MDISKNGKQLRAPKVVELDSQEDALLLNSLHHDEEMQQLQKVLFNSFSHSSDFVNGAVKKTPSSIDESHDSIVDQSLGFQKLLFESSSANFSSSHASSRWCVKKAKGIEEFSNSIIEDQTPEFQKLPFESSSRKFSSDFQDGFKNSSTDVKAKGIEESCNSISLSPDATVDDYFKNTQDLKRKSIDKSCSIEDNDSDIQDDNLKKPQDLKGKSIDKSCYLENYPESIFRGRIIQKGEASCTICVICNDAKPLGSTSMKTVKKCGHHFCGDCIKNYVGEKIQENPKEIKCPESKCKEILDIDLIKSLVPDKDFLHHWRKVFAELGGALGKKETLECPYDSYRKTFSDDQRKCRIITCTNSRLGPVKYIKLSMRHCYNK